MRVVHSILVSLALGALVPPRPAAGSGNESSAFDAACRNAEQSLQSGNTGTARAWIERAMERDAKSPRVWDLRARWAEAVNEKDEQAYSLHEELRLSIAQKLPAKEIEDLRARIVAIDPIAPDLFNLSKVFVAKLKAVADEYEKDKRPHSAIRVHKEILALDPDLTASQDAIQRLASSPDPSLAGDAKPKDLLAGVSEEWIRKHDLEHESWAKRDRLERPNYVTYTDAGYAVMIRAAEAMEQMNAFYRQFFHYGTEEDHHSVPRIELHIFKQRDEYLKHGKGPPVEWSGGQFTGDSVETYIDEGGFASTSNTLFHEAAHEFVSMATGAAGWLNEGLASFFEGCRMLSNGTVIMNLPATHRLFPLVERMQKGWMSSWNDGIDTKNQSKSNPEKAPTFKIVLEDEYEWGPAWYAPTWGVVYFLYNYQDPVDGRYVYRAAFHRFIDKSGGRVKKGAVDNFEKTVLADPLPPIPGVVRPKGAADVRLPKTCPELDEVWKDWLVELSKEQSGEIVVAKPYLQWARYAVKNKDIDVAREHFEKGLVATPGDPDLMLEYASFLADHKNTDRASKLALDAVRIVESKNPVDEKGLRAAERALEKVDPKRRSLEAVHKELWTTALAILQRYSDAKMTMMVMDLSWRMSNDLRVPGVLDYYAAAVRQSGKSIGHWQLAYNEKNLDGWSVPARDAVFTADGVQIKSQYKGFSETGFDYQFMALDTVTSGDYSLEAEVLAEQGKVSFAGLVFGKKSANEFHGLVFFPPRKRDETDKKKAELAANGFIDLMSGYGAGASKTWRHVPVSPEAEKKQEATHVGTWHKLRIDVAGSIVDCWFDGEYLTTQDFGSEDVLRGAIGLITGQGEARYSDVRFLSRQARDAAAQIERKIRLEKLEKSAAGGEAVSVGGSFLGHVAPFPSVKSWVQGARSTWLEKGPVPQLLVLWSIQQNDLVPIDKWLADVARKYAEYGLEIVNVASPNDADAIGAYLKAHAFPGAVAIDKREGRGIGDTFTTYSVERFNLPRVLLLDIDAKVVWEGDPGFKSGVAYTSGAESFLDTPLAELVEKRKLKELTSWMSAWRDKASPALAKGDLAGAVDVLKRAKELPSGLIPAIDDAQKKLATIEGALANLKDTAAAFAQDEAEPAFPCLLAYAPVMKHAIDKNTRVSLQPTLDAKSVKDWALALTAVDRAKNHPKPEEKVQFTQELVTRLGKLSGRFPRELLADVQPALANNDLATLQQLFVDAPQRPQKWLVSEYLRW